MAAASSASILSFSNFSASSAASFFSFSILAASSAASFFSFSILAASSIASFFSFSILAASSAASLGRVAGAPIGSGLSSPTESALTISSLGFSSLESLASATATAVAIATGATTATGRDSSEESALTIGAGGSSITISSPANFAKRSQISFGMNGGPFLAEQTLNTISESGDSNFLPTNPSNNNFIFVSSPPIICPPKVNVTPVSSNKETGSFLPDTIFIVPVLICNPLSLFNPDPITLAFVAAILNILAILPYVI